MVTRFLLLVITFFHLLSSNGWSAFTFTTQQLSEFCQSNQDYGQGVCAAYLMAYKNNGPILCIPAGVRLEQVIKVFTKWSIDHPELLHLEADIGVYKALNNAFPCIDLQKEQSKANVHIFLDKAEFITKAEQNKKGGGSSLGNQINPLYSLLN
jgi:hypothetical protein